MKCDFTAKKEKLKTESKIKKYFKNIVFNIQNSRRVMLPDALTGLKLKRIFFAGVVAILSVCAALYIKRAELFLLLLFSIFMLMYAFKLNYDYYCGNISEQKLLCIDTKIRFNQVDVVFVDENENRKVLSFGNKKQMFYENVEYLVYTYKSMPKVILAFSEYSEE